MSLTKLSAIFFVSFFASLNVFAQTKDPVFFQENGLWGLKNDKGEVIVKPKYTNGFNPYFNVYYTEYAHIVLNGKHGFIDKQGKEVVPPRFDEISGIHFGDFVFVKLDKKWGLLNTKTLTEITNFVYDYMEYETSYTIYNPDNPVEERNVYLLKINNGGNNAVGGKWGVFYINGMEYKEVLSVAYDKVEVSNVYLVRKDNLWGSFDLEGNPILPIKYSYIEYNARKDQYLVSVDGGNKVQNSGWYDDRHYAGGKWGIVNRMDEAVVPLQYDYIRPKPVRANSEHAEVDKYIKVGNQNKFGIIDDSGKIVLQLKYDDIDDNIFSFNDFMDILPYHDQNGLFLVKLNGKWGLVNIEDKLIVPCSYDKIIYRNGIYEVIERNKKSYFNKFGKKLTQKEAQKITSIETEGELIGY